MKGNRERTDLGEGRWEKLGEVDRRETVVGVYSMQEESIFKK